MNTKEDIICDLKGLGIESGDTLFLRISYKAIGKTEGGPKTIIDSILEVIGSEGTIIATAFPERQSSLMSFHKVIYEPGKNIYTGVIPSLMAKYDGAFFSLNPISPFVCIGKNAKVLTEFHTPDKHNLALIAKAIEISHPKCLRIGGDPLDGTTHIAFSEGLEKNHHYHLRRPEGIYYYDKNKLKYKSQDMSFFCKSGFKKFYEEHIITNKLAVIGKGKIGQGDAVLTDMRTTLAIERKWIVPNPQILLCNNPDCLSCRSSYSYSDYSLLGYLCKLWKLNLKKEIPVRQLLRGIRENIILFFWGKKCQ